MASFPFSGDYRIVIVGRNWQQLPTTLASRSPRFIGYGVSYFGCFPGSNCIEHLMKYELTSLRLLQQIKLEVSQMDFRGSLFGLRFKQQTLS